MTIWFKTKNNRIEKKRVGLSDPLFVYTIRLPNIQKRGTSLQSLFPVCYFVVGHDLQEKGVGMCNRRRLYALSGVMAALIASVCTADKIPVIFEPTPGNPSSQTLYWQTSPGQRYRLYETDDLTAPWQLLPGYPVTAGSMAASHTTALAGRGFLRVEALDESPPRLVERYPAVDGFAVSRTSPLRMRYEEPSGLDAASVSVSLSSDGTTHGFFRHPALACVSNTLTFTPPEGLYLGDWGATVTATVAVSDLLGYRATHVWSFRLEPEPQARPDLFVFGSPAALRMGQVIRGPTVSLSARSPVTRAPFAMAPTSAWGIGAVSTNTLVIAYTNGTPPAFTAGQLICNQTPASAQEVFYRRITAVSNDSVNAQVILQTVDADLTNFVAQGAVSMGSQSEFFDLSQPAAARQPQSVTVSGGITFPPIGIDLSGTAFYLLDDGYQLVMLDEIVKRGSGETNVTCTMTEWYWRLTPSLQASLEIDWTGIKAFEAQVIGDVACAQVLELYSLLLDAEWSDTLFDHHPPPSSLIYLGQIGPVPVFATLGYRFTISAHAMAKAELFATAGYRQQLRAAFGVDYTRDDGLGWIRSFDAAKPDLFGDATLTGELGFGIAIEPSVEFLVYGVAGAKASLVPSADVSLSATLSLADGYDFDGELDASLDFVLGPSGALFEGLGLDKHTLSINLWHEEFPLVPQGLSFSRHPRSVETALDDDVRFTCTVTAAATPAYQWYHQNLPIAGETRPSFYIPRVNNGHTGTYYVCASRDGTQIQSQPATLTIRAENPENDDSDLDGIPDIHETATGIWVSSTDRGTRPDNWDSDGDGLSDAVESNTRNFVSPDDTGTNPLTADTDGDGVSDPQEIARGTDPNQPDQPIVTPVEQVSLSGGPFQIGDAWDDAITSFERPVHIVTLSPFRIDTTLVSWAYWQEVRGWALLHGYAFGTQATGAADDRPVQDVSWYDAVKWCNARSEREGLSPAYYTDTGRTAVYRSGEVDLTKACVDWNAGGYRLPTNAEWEYAARGGLSGRRFPWGDTITHAQANYMSATNYTYDTSATRDLHPAFNGAASPVTYFPPNGYGLYDMCGNLKQWCWDRYAGYTSASETDPRGNDTGQRCYRCGSADQKAQMQRVAFRQRTDPGSIDKFGFRCVRSGY